MSDEPEKIRAWRTGIQPINGDSGLWRTDTDIGTEYVRADFTAWQPIETAPRDGTVILFRVPNAKRPIKMGQYINAEAEWAVIGWKCMNGRFHDPDIWMPLPEPPK